MEMTMAIFSSDAVEQLGRRLRENEKPKRQEKVITIISGAQTCRVASDDVSWVQGLYKEGGFDTCERYALKRATFDMLLDPTFPLLRFMVA
jgi:hypothetical protein